MRVKSDAQDDQTDTRKNGVYVELTKNGELMTHAEYLQMLRRIGLKDELPDYFKVPQPFAAISTELFNQALKNLSRLHADASDAELAAKYLRLARDLCPNHPHIHENLGLAYLMQADGLRLFEVRVVDADRGAGALSSVYNDDATKSLRKLGIIQEGDSIDLSEPEGRDGKTIRLVTKYRMVLRLHREESGGKPVMVVERTDGRKFILDIDPYYEPSVVGDVLVRKFHDKETREKFLRLADSSIDESFKMNPGDPGTASKKAMVYYARYRFAETREEKVAWLDKAASGFDRAFCMKKEKGLITERGGLGIMEERNDLYNILRLYDRLYSLTGNKGYLESIIKLYDNPSILDNNKHEACSIKAYNLMRLHDVTTEPAEKRGYAERAISEYAHAAEQLEKHKEFEGSSWYVTAGSYHLARGRLESALGLEDDAKRSYLAAAKRLGWGGSDTLDGLIGKLKKQSEKKFQGRSDKENEEMSMVGIVLPELEKIKKDPNASKSFNEALSKMK